jgi:hypothetical protein
MLWIASVIPSLAMSKTAAHQDITQTQKKAGGSIKLHTPFHGGPCNEITIFLLSHGLNHELYVILEIL